METNMTEKRASSCSIWCWLPIFLLSLPGLPSGGPQLSWHRSWRPLHAGLLRLWGCETATPSGEILLFLFLHNAVSLKVKLFHALARTHCKFNIPDAQKVRRSRPPPCWTVSPGGNRTRQEQTTLTGFTGSYGSTRNKQWRFPTSLPIHYFIHNERIVMESFISDNITSLFTSMCFTHTQTEKKNVSYNTRKFFNE